MRQAGEGKDTLPKFAALVVLAGAVGLAGSYLIPRSEVDRWAAFVGVAEATFSGAAALSLKRWALQRSVRAALAMMAVVFGVRFLLVAAGLAYVKVKQGGVMAYVAGFFGVYFAVQGVEISYVLVESKRRGRGEL